MASETRPKVFISYAHDSPEHAARVLAFAQRLRTESGIDCDVDQFYNGTPEQGWPAWMEERLDWADFILVVGSPRYVLRYELRETQGGLGATWEGAIIRDRLYASRTLTTNILPVVFGDASTEWLPKPLRYSRTHYRLDADYQKLLRVVTNQPSVVPAPLGPLPQLGTGSASPAAPTQSASHYEPGVERFRAEYLGTQGNPVPFGGRASELDALDEWLDTGTESSLLLTAPAGRGKSALLVRWVEQLRARTETRVVFFPISSRFRTNLARSALPALIAGVAAAVNTPLPVQYEESIASWKATLSSLLARTPPDGTRLVVVIDGIDEVGDWEVDTETFPPKLAERVRIVASARGDQATGSERWLRSLGWTARGLARTMRLAALSPDGVADVLVRMGMPLDELGRRVDIVHEIHRLTLGDPLLVGLYVGDLWTKGDEVARLTPGDLAGIKPGLEGYFDRWWDDQRRLWKGEAPLKANSLSMVLSVLASALGPLSRDDLLALLPREARVDSALALAETLLPLSRFLVGDGLSVGYGFSHPRLASYFYGQLSESECVAWDERFLALGRNVFAKLDREAPRERDRYAVQFYGAHLIRANAPVDELMQLVDARWMRAWTQLGGGYAGFVADVARAHQRVIENNREAVSRGERPRLELEVRCTLWQTSINSLVREIPLELTIALISERLWKVADGIDHLRRLPKLRQQAHGLAALLEALPESSSELLGEAVRVAAAAEDTHEETDVFSMLDRFLPATIRRPRAVQARRLSSSDDRAAETPSDRPKLMLRHFAGSVADLWMVDASDVRDDVLLALAWFMATEDGTAAPLVNRALRSNQVFGDSWVRGAILLMLEHAGDLETIADQFHLIRMTGLAAEPTGARTAKLTGWLHDTPAEATLVLALLLPFNERGHLVRSAVAELADRRGGAFQALHAALHAELGSEPYVGGVRTAHEALGRLAQHLDALDAVPHDQVAPDEHDESSITAAAIDPAAVLARFADTRSSERARMLHDLLSGRPKPALIAAIDELSTSARELRQMKTRFELLAILAAMDPRAELAPEVALELLLASGDDNVTDLPDSILRKIIATIPRLREGLEHERFAAAFAGIALDNETEVLLLVLLPPELVWPMMRGEMSSRARNDLEEASLDEAPQLAANLEFLLLLTPVFRRVSPGWCAGVATRMRAIPGSLSDKLFGLYALGLDDLAVREVLVEQRDSDHDLDLRDLLDVLVDGPADGRLERARSWIETLADVECALGCLLLARHAPGAALATIRARFEGDRRRFLLAEILPHVESADRRDVADELLDALAGLDKATGDLQAIKLRTLLVAAHADESCLVLLAALRVVACLDSEEDERPATLDRLAALLPNVRKRGLLRRALLDACGEISDDDQRANALRAVGAHLSPIELWGACNTHTNGMLSRLEKVMPDVVRDWRADPAILLRHLAVQRDEQLEYFVAQVPDHLLGALLDELADQPAEQLRSLIQSIAGRLPSTAVAKAVRMIDVDNDPKVRLALSDQLLEIISRDARDSLEAVWIRSALEVARGVTNADELELLRGTLVQHGSRVLGRRSDVVVSEMIRSIGTPSLRVTLFGEVITLLSIDYQNSLGQDLLETCRVFEPRKDRLTLLVRLAQRLRGPMRRTIVAEALRTTQSIEDGTERIELLVALAPWADEAAREHMFGELAELPDVAVRFRLLGELAPHLSDPDRSLAVKEAVAAAQIQTWFRQTDSLRFLGEQLRGVGLSEICDALDRVPLERDRANAFCAIAPMLTPELLDRARESIRELSHDMHRVSALLGIAGYLPPAARTAELFIDDQLDDPAAIAHLAVGRLRYLSGEELTNAIEIALAALPKSNMYRRRRDDVIALAAVVSLEQVPLVLDAARQDGGPEHFVNVVAAIASRDDVRDRAELLVAALAALHEIENCEHRAAALVVIAPRLAPSQLAHEIDGAVGMARATASARRRAATIAILGRLLAPDLLAEELTAVLAHAVADERIAMLRMLAPVLPEQLQREAIRMISARTTNHQGRELLALVGTLPSSLEGELLAAARLVREGDAQSELVASLSGRSTSLPLAKRYARFSQSLQVLASGSRAGFMHGVRALVPSLVEIGGRDAARESVRCILESTAWL